MDRMAPRYAEETGYGEGNGADELMQFCGELILIKPDLQYDKPPVIYRLVFRA